MAHSGTTQSAQHCKLFHHSKIKTKLHHICYFKTKSRRTKTYQSLGGSLRAYRPDGQK
jgi:hypothetical protein